MSKKSLSCLLYLTAITTNVVLLAKYYLPLLGPSKALKPLHTMLKVPVRAVSHTKNDRGVGKPRD